MITPEEEKQQKEVLATAYHSYSKGLNSYAFFKINNQGVGEELVQDAFIKTWKYLLRGGKIDIMKAFLYHVLNDLVVDEYRKHKTTSLDILLEKGFEPSSGDSGHILNVLDGKAALLLIQRLPETYQKVMRMKYVQDLSLKEMSLITGQSKNTIAVQAHRGLGKLKRLYKSS
ncbi:MAG TPA: sigma-70 family RNA polymerase sigma factor [Candidatus Paceibacterota bacterium]